MQIRTVKQPRDEGPHFLRVPSPKSPPRFMGPNHGKDETAEGKDWIADGDGTVTDFFSQFSVNSLYGPVQDVDHPAAKNEAPYAVQNEPADDRPNDRIELAGGVYAFHPRGSFKPPHVHAEEWVFGQRLTVCRYDKRRQDVRLYLDTLLRSTGIDHVGVFRFVPQTGKEEKQSDKRDAAS